jgi:hypothetical protein
MKRRWEVEWLVKRLGILIPRGRFLFTCCVPGWVCPRAGLDAVGKEINFPFLEIELRSCSSTIPTDARKQDAHESTVGKRVKQCPSKLLTGLYVTLFEAVPWTNTCVKLRGLSLILSAGINLSVSVLTNLWAGDLRKESFFEANPTFILSDCNNK